MLTDENVAWLMQEYLGGRTQKSLADELKTVSSVISNKLMKFYDKYGDHGPQFTHIEEYYERRDAYFKEALYRYQAFGGKLEKPAARESWTTYVNPNSSADLAWSRARGEHAFLLRAEGCTFQQIADAFGISRDRARQITEKFCRQVRGMLTRCKTRWWFEEGKSNDELYEKYWCY